MAARLALIVATSTYVDPYFSELRAPAEDAEDLADVLSDPTIGDFDVGRVIDQPHSKIAREIQAFFDGRSLDDFLVLHLSCHGVKDDNNRLFFAATDTERSLLDATALASEYVLRLLDRCRARSKVLLVDCCYSGAILAGRKGDRGVHLKERLAGKGRAILTASNEIEYAWEGGETSGTPQPSLFTAAIVEGLRSGAADRDSDGEVSVNELYDHVYERVLQTGRGQTPLCWNELQGHLYIAHNPRLMPSTARTLINKGFGQDEQGQWAKSIEVYEEVVHRFGDASELDLREQVAKALVRKGLVSFCPRQREERRSSEFVCRPERGCMGQVLGLVPARHPLAEKLVTSC